MSFISLGLQTALAAAAARLGYTGPTAIQQAAIAPILRGEDVLATARTGSGKTAAFVLPLLQRWQAAPRGERPALHTLVLVPTRELAMQVGAVFRALSEGLPQAPKLVLAYGGVSINPQMMALRGWADIVVATPGRLLDLLAHNALRLDALHTLVLDEADRLLEQGFADELARILALLPAQRQNLLFSATMAPTVERLAGELLHEPCRIDIASEEPLAIKERAIAVDAARRTALLVELLRQQSRPQVLVFVASQRDCERVAAKLGKAGLAAAAWHGDLSQGRRSQVLADFKAGRIQLLIATDVAARGIDIADLPLVVNYDLPRSTADYTHRIGRTGRAGQQGEAISLVSADSEMHFRLIEKRLGKRLRREQLTGFEPSDVAVPSLHDPQGNGGIKGKRKSKKDKLREAAAQAGAPEAAKE
ncbi:DEAD/DEAH box helicase [Chitinimonas sp.]|uniref:DEAD/DEAH box helicase n=1 Tax=Chitinimonas sp. TaxID=1934313 RepID=UPI0035B2FD2D